MGGVRGDDGWDMFAGFELLMYLFPVSHLLLPPPLFYYFNKKTNRGYHYATR